MTVDAATGEILEHHPAGGREKKADFDALLRDVESSKKRAEKVFDQGLSALEDRGRVLEEKFRRALERAEKEDDGTPPVRPWDLD